MAEKIELEVTLKENLKELNKLAGDVNLNKRQRESIEKNTRGAELSLQNKDFKDFIKYFNNIIKVVKDAAIASGGISEQIKALSLKKDEIRRELEKLETKKGELSSKVGLNEKGKPGLRESASQEFFEKKSPSIYKTTGEMIADRKELSLYVTKLEELIKDVGALNKVTNEKARSIGLADRNTAYAISGYVRDENAEAKSSYQELGNIESQIVQAQTSFNDLEKQLEQIAPKGTEAAQSLDQLFVSLNKLADLTNQAVKPQTTPKGKQEKVVSNPTGLSNQSVELTEKQTGTVGKLVKQFTLYHIALRSIKTAARAAVNTIKDLDKYLTEQAMVTGKTRKETYGLLDGYQKLAKQLGATTKEVAEVATQYMRQGKTTEEAMTLTNAAISAAKVAGINTAESVDYLTTALNGFQLAASDAMKVSDKFAAVAANSATSYEEIATALSKVAAQANLAGMSIDYTTAILAKGIETTREAPETIGTALKTVIARMRELKDYGATLGGDIDVNNVETQLAYVGIRLKDNNGELRSTEDVLDELGKKWDTLNSNQQAAVAKALAGTRQQSRLIAMMTDYERVIELQEIAQRSQGATVAQMATYTEGMEAAMNNVKVAWEQIVTTITNSDVLITMVNAFGNILGVVDKILSNTGVMVALLVTAGVATVAWVGHKVRALALTKQLEKAEKRMLVVQKQQENEEKRLSLATSERLLKEKGITLQKAIQSGDESAIAKAQAEYDTEKAKHDLLKAEIGVNDELISRAESSLTVTGFISAGIKDILSGLGAMVFPLTMVIGLIKKATIATRKQKDETRQLSAWQAFWSASAIPVVGFAIGAGILAAILGITLAIKGTGSGADKTSTKINQLSNEIYKLQEEKTAITNVINEFDKLDEKILKTKKDTEEMASALAKAGDQLSSESGKSSLEWLNKRKMSEQDYYKTLTTDKARKDFLEEVSRSIDERLAADRQKQLDYVNKLDSEQLKKFMSESKYSDARAAIYAINNQNLYDYADSIKAVNKLTDEESKAVEKLTQSILEELDATKALEYANTPGKIKAVVDSLSAISLTIDGGKVNVADILGNEDIPLTEQVKAYKAIAEGLSGITESYNAFVNVYSEFEVFTEMNNQVLQFIDESGLTIDKLNELYTGYSKLQKAGFNITEEEYKSRYQSYLEALANFNGDVTSATQQVFGDLLTGAEDYTKAWNALINNFGNLIEKGILNMGQDIDTFKNTVNSFYEKASNWGSMSETDRTQFISDNAELFAGAQGEALIEALERGNYNALEAALAANETFSDKRQQLIKQVEQELQVELAREGDARNEAYIRQLQDYKTYLENESKLYKANIKTRLEQEEKALSAYKEMLEKQRDAQTAALEKRKEAYSQYFEDINKQQEEEDYESKTSTDTKSITKYIKAGTMHGKVSTHSITSKPAVAGAMSTDSTKTNIKTLTSGTSSYYFTPTSKQTSEGTSTAKAQAIVDTGKAGWISVGSSDETAASTATINATCNDGAKVYLQGAVNSGKVSTHTISTTPGVTATATANGFTPATSPTLYYVSPSCSVTTVGKSTAKAKGSITTEGYIGTGDSTESGASTIDITPTCGNSGVVYIPAASGLALAITKSTATITPGTTAASDVGAGYRPLTVTVKGTTTATLGMLSNSGELTATAQVVGKIKNGSATITPSTSLGDLTTTGTTKSILDNSTTPTSGQTEGVDYVKVTMNGSASSSATKTSVSTGWVETGDITIATGGTASKSNTVYIPVYRGAIH